MHGPGLLDIVFQIPMHVNIEETIDMNTTETDRYEWQATD